MNVIRYQITLLQPVLTTAVEGDPNNSVALSFLPGSILKGMIIGLYLGSKKQMQLERESVDDNDRKVSRLFFSTQTRYLNGYPLVSDQAHNLYRGLPTPLSFYFDEVPENQSSLCQPNEKPSLDVFDFAIKQLKFSKPKKIKQPFCTMASKSLYTGELQRHITIHTTRDRRFGKARKQEIGAVYQYEALAAGQTFEAYILCENSEDVNDLQELLKGYTYLGGARSSGYGRVALNVVPLDTELLNQPWKEVNLPTVINLDAVTITLLSDLVLRDQNGQFTTDPQYITQIPELLGSKLIDAFVGYRVVGGFNRKWGLPLPQVPVFQMGSVFVLKLSHDVDWQTLQLKGIGENRIDGFGRIAINWQREATLSLITVTSEKTASLSLPDEQSQKIAYQMVRRMLRQKANEALDKQALSLTENVASEKIPHKNQLYNLRLLLQKSVSGLSSKTPSEVSGYLTQCRKNLTQTITKLEGRTRIARQFKKLWIDDQPSLMWLQARITEQSVKRTQSILDLNALPWIGNLPEKEDELASKLWDEQMVFEFNLRLADAVLAYLAKKKEEQNG